jgi:hypothetical protein
MDKNIQLLQIYVESLNHLFYNIAKIEYKNGNFVIFVFSAKPKY